MDLIRRYLVGRERNYRRWRGTRIVMLLEMKCGGERFGDGESIGLEAIV